MGKLHFSIEILIFYTKNCVFLRFFYGFKIIHFNFHLRYLRALKNIDVYFNMCYDLYLTKICLSNKDNVV